MRTRLPILFAVLGLAALATLASAETAKLGGKHGVGEIRNACSKAGGNFSVAPDGGGYACHKANCDGKGGSCSVDCDNNNNCTGTTPGKAGPRPGKGVKGVLSGPKSAGVVR